MRLSKSGRPTDVYGCWQPQQTQMLHEVLLTGELLKCPHVPVNRGKHVDAALRPDATLFIGPAETPLHVELDRNTEGYRAVKRRIRSYAAFGEPVLWIAPTVARMDGLRRVCRPIAAVSYFKVLGADLLYDFDGREYRPTFFSTPSGVEASATQAVAATHEARGEAY